MMGRRTTAGRLRALAPGGFALLGALLLAGCATRGRVVYVHVPADPAPRAPERPPKPSSTGAPQPFRFDPAPVGPAPGIQRLPPGFTT